MVNIRDIRKLEKKKRMNGIFHSSAIQNSVSGLGLSYYAFRLIQFRSSKAVCKRLIKLSSPLRSQTRGS